MKSLQLTEKEGLYSLTDLWKASGKTNTYRPYNWMRWDGAEFVRHIQSKLVGSTTLKTVKGRYGGTYAHWQIALAYAKYLSPALHARVNEVFKYHQEQEHQVPVSSEKLTPAVIGGMFFQEVSNIISPLVFEVQQLTQAVHKLSSESQYRPNQITDMSVQGDPNYKTVYEYCSLNGISQSKREYKSDYLRIAKEAKENRIDVKQKGINGKAPLRYTYPITFLEGYFYG